MTDIRKAAAARLDEALSAANALDPRDSFRDALRALKERDAAKFEEAKRHFEGFVVPRVAEPDSDPLAEWLKYGYELARRSGAGALHAIDPSGLARPAEEGEPPGPGELLLFIPNDGRTPVLELAGPASPTPPQEATRDLLVRGKLSLTP